MDHDDIDEKGSPAKLAAFNTGLMEQLAQEAREEMALLKRGSYILARNPEIIAELLNYLYFGLSIEIACKTVGISPRTLSTWRKDDADLDAEIEAAAEAGYESLEAILISIMSGGRHSTGDVRRDDKLCKRIEWIMSKRNRRYADRVDVTSNGNTLPSVILPAQALPGWIPEAEFEDVVSIPKTPAQITSDEP